MGTIITSNSLLHVQTFAQGTNLALFDYFLCQSECKQNLPMLFCKTLLIPCRLARKTSVKCENTPGLKDLGGNNFKHENPPISSRIFTLDILPLLIRVLRPPVHFGLIPTVVFPVFTTVVFVGFRLVVNWGAPL